MNGEPKESMTGGMKRRGARSTRRTGVRKSAARRTGARKSATRRTGRKAGTRKHRQQSRRRQQSQQRQQQSQQRRMRGGSGVGDLI